LVVLIYGEIGLIKEGLITATQGRSRSMMFNSPHIWIFSYDLPELDELHGFNVVVWEVNESFELVPHQ
jgi:hypothetical protein